MCVYIHMCVCVCVCVCVCACGPRLLDLDPKLSGKHDTRDKKRKNKDGGPGGCVIINIIIVVFIFTIIIIIIIIIMMRGAETAPSCPPLWRSCGRISDYSWGWALEIREVGGDRNKRTRGRGRHGHDKHVGGSNPGPV